MSLRMPRPLGLLLLTGAFLSPFYTLQPFPIFLTLSDLILILALFVAIVDPSAVLRVPKPLVKIGGLGTTLLVLSFLASDLVRGNLGFETISVVLQYAFVLLILPILLGAVSYNTRVTLVTAYLTGILAVVACGVIIYAGFPGLYGRLTAKGLFIAEQRMGSFLGPNGLAKTIALSIPLLYLAGKRRIVGGVFLGVWSVICLVGILLSASFGGMASAATACILVGLLDALLYRRGATKKFVLAVALSITAGLTVVGAYSYRPEQWKAASRIERAIQGGDLDQAGSFSSKRGLMFEAWEHIKAEPIIGLGSQQYPVYSVTSSSVHNSFLLIWAEGGIVALLGFLVAFGGFALTAIRSMASSSTRAAGIAGVAALLVFLMNSITNTHAYSRFWYFPVVLPLILEWTGNAVRGGGNENTNA